MIDLTPEALQNRMRRGDVYPQERVGRALENFFRETNLIACGNWHCARWRNRWIKASNSTRRGREKSRRGCHPRTHRGVHQLEPGGAVSDCARRPHGPGHECRAFCGLYRPRAGCQRRQSADPGGANVRFAENVGASIVRLKGKSVAHAVAEFVNEKHITQIVFGRSATRGWKRYFYLSAIHQFLRDAPAVDVHIVTQEPG
jgi:two-component system sensor histidine kinase KdpD